ncbi:tRNA (adenosine(37)-N6)-threonylcarbamoyltransferase complex ATPase subunit type 1 TsaE [Gammaproteobacteria bacterium]|jgi:tRNA threonylcarbamoyladenosine biosynthesis protein TsaE|uniref:tRNA threonylcarbamoyladenosine biosynthesis protein TsaE n=1 Tax=Gamma-proteobacterium EBAC31A08 TaxID=133804 RepID=Q9F7S1_PRB01|nr:predicted kinase of the phosphomethylpyrimidine kinase (ThiD) family [uncultured marine gamma proteobacterium EBAC31A08]MDA7778572.1 tRNA (adenosine(37)-N6)-threonylcarbamoyltransferase complex ATPase subunit type 1 TsaE [Gammaproteobacteria bacterium]MDA9133390.1 tRNA (adenosine(37)-N6)-threonylcarbamoyltransferase complex ATPase subunit type 1 TsaE [Gammaproteobacteria bacterium]MDA9322324.1 tRNA (adenosine(37)-N6)-threonylcarbamoyltransferase complex ATPase subunit type 1 TsaE [Gammaproteo|tara:strand:- start:919 stop:1380 length:462 start_codon:yes stop_codon:yes gene_type:complete
MKKLTLINDEATNQLGSKIAMEILKSSSQEIEIHLEGDLGAGKTFISRSIIKNCGWKDLVKSPTYTLCEEYDFNNLMFLHIDLYRTNEAEDIDIFDLSRKINSKKVVLIEWPERLQHERSFDLKIIFSHLPEGREVSLISGDNGFKEWLKTYE